MLQPIPKPIAGAPRTRTSFLTQQQGRLLFALVVLLIALAIVLVGDHGIWGSDQADSELATPQQVQAAAKSAPATTEAPSVPAPPVNVKKQAPAAKSPVEPKPAESGIVATERTVLPPLNVEVVTAHTRHAARPRSNAMKVEITNAAPTAPAEVAPSAPATEAAERERLSAGSVSTAAVQTPDVTYPPLTQHMNVQGSVVLQALIGVDGIIENLRVVSGPAILATAAQQAVREWRFKPIYQNGQAVETKAKITVNFTIKVADGSEKTTLAESRNDSLLILTR